MEMTSLQSVKRRRLLALVLFFVLLLGGWAIPFPQSITGPCQVVSPSVWVLRHDGTGQITAEWVSNLLDDASGDFVFQFDRPDVIELRIAPGIVDGASVAAGDTVARIGSREGLMRLDVLQGELEEAVAKRRALLSGGRIEDLEVARNRLRKSEEELEAFQYEYRRVKALYDSSLVSLARFQETEGRLRVLEAERDLDASRVKALEAGARPEDVGVIEAEIEGIKRQIQRAQSTLGRIESVIAPIGGRVRRNGEPGVMLAIERTDTLAVRMMIPEAFLPALMPGREIRVRLFAEPALHLSAPVKRTGFLPAGGGGYAYAWIGNKDGILRPGMNGLGRVKIGNRTLLQGLKARLAGWGG